MKIKELKNLAEKIAEFEYIIQTSQDKDEVEIAKESEIRLSKNLNFNDMDILDDMIRQILKQKLK